MDRAFGIGLAAIRNRIGVQLPVGARFGPSDNENRVGRHMANEDEVVTLVLEDEPTEPAWPEQLPA